MRQKYNVFDVSKINSKTIKIAQKLKEEIEKTKPFKEAFLRDPESTHVPIDDDKFLEHLCLKYLHLQSEDGIPLLKQAFKQQYNIEDEYNICKYCRKPFKFARANSVFCSDRCRQRFCRSQKRGGKKVLGVTLSRFLTDRENLEFCVSGMLLFVSFLSVTHLPICHHF